MTEQWQRVHPASPFVRGWVAIVGLAYIYWQNTNDLTLAERLSGERLRWTVLIGAGALLVVLVFYALSWYFTRYRITGTHVYVNSGMVFRSQKQARIDRVQGIEVAQPLVARLLGLAELHFDVADGSQSMLRLSFLRKADAQRLRALILGRAQAARNGQAPLDGQEADSVPDTAASAAQAPDPDVLMARVPHGRLLASLFLRMPTIIGVLSALALGIMTLSGVGGMAAGLIPALLGFGGWFYKELNNSWNFSAAATDTGLRVSRGLADTRQQSIPAGRVQSIQVSSPALWRLLGWYRVEVNALGVGSQEEAQNLLVLPVGDFDAVARVMGILLPDLGVERQREVLFTAINSGGEEHGFTLSPHRAKPLSPGAWKNQGFLATDTTVISRYGWLGRITAFTAHNRVQGIMLRQGPLERRRQLAGLRIYSAGGTVTGYIQQVDAQIAGKFLEEQSRRIAGR
ncbi:PH domain-containing protein [Glutamicibacter protophormiae]|uniref:PH domain-containing protein n=1 Tax=Glutamicibacter protophormiae TaxID=37930 RepID=UPI00195A59E5|nr:PH domain-containing protein [Glutamicibacter protophormiae]QRQ78788.1 PH domain-containing protein [Glutamicibacter protophormiae]WPR64849.1 PH domain-containing protein [Glutamicibacter protophormiae]WPR68345.1 PH domain-containing protein [Glutamicibacter protophormiae]